MIYQKLNGYLARIEFLTQDAIDWHADTVLFWTEQDGLKVILPVENIEPRQEFLARVLI